LQLRISSPPCIALIKFGTLSSIGHISHIGHFTSIAEGSTSHGDKYDVVREPDQGPGEAESGQQPVLFGRSQHRRRWGVPDAGEHERHVPGVSGGRRQRREEDDRHLGRLLRLRVHHHQGRRREHRPAPTAPGRCHCRRRRSLTCEGIQKISVHLEDLELS
jgi:hypothetical protein